MRLFFSLILVLLGLSAQNIKLSHVANQGVLIEGKTHKIIIDGLFTEVFNHLSAPSEQQLIQMKNGHKPFDHIDFILVTHEHGDHFNAEMIGNYLKKNSKSRLFAPQEAVAKLDSIYDQSAAIRSQIFSIDLNPLGKQSFDLGDALKIDVKRLHHSGNSPWKEAENIAYTIHMDGKQIVHVGDALIDSTNFSNFNSDNKKINLIITPIWALRFLDVIEQYLKPGKVIVSHIPKSVPVNQLPQQKDLIYFSKLEDQLMLD